MKFFIGDEKNLDFSKCLLQIIPFSYVVAFNCNVFQWQLLLDHLSRDVDILYDFEFVRRPDVVFTFGLFM